MKIHHSASVADKKPLFIVVPDKFNNKTFGKTLSVDHVSLIKSAIKAKHFATKLGSVWTAVTKNSHQTVFLIGMDDFEKNNSTANAAASLVRHATKHHLRDINVLLPDQSCLYQAALGAYLGSYTFKVGNTKDQIKINNITFIKKEKSAASLLKRAKAIADSINWVRDLINLPAGHMYPQILAKEALKISKGFRNPIKVKILPEKELKKLGMGSLLAVGQGSVNRPCMVVMEYWGDRQNRKNIKGLVGKGVCFDSGGYNIKPTRHVEDMKLDMSGAATVMGVFRALATLKPKANVIGILGIVENLVSDNAYKPGDIITAMNGLTIEVSNTDAEGRLVLADCISYIIKKFKPTQIVDIATLTGACMVALGYRYTGIMGNNEKLTKEITQAAADTQELIWPLPLDEEFCEAAKGGISDLKNATDGVMAGASMGAAFLHHFVQETPWAHLDIAGSAYHDTSGNHLSPPGARGAMVSTLIKWIENSSK